MAAVQIAYIDYAGNLVFRPFPPFRQGRRPSIGLDLENYRVNTWTNTARIRNDIVRRRQQAPGFLIQIPFVHTASGRASGIPTLLSDTLQVFNGAHALSNFVGLTQTVMALYQLVCESLMGVIDRQYQTRLQAATQRRRHPPRRPRRGRMHYRFNIGIAIEVRNHNVTSGVQNLRTSYVWRQYNIARAEQLVWWILHTMLSALGDRDLDFYYEPADANHLAQGFPNMGLQAGATYVLLRFIRCEGTLLRVGAAPKQSVIHSAAITLFEKRPKDHFAVSHYLRQHGLAAVRVTGFEGCLGRSLGILLDPKGFRKAGDAEARARRWHSRKLHQVLEKHLDEAQRPLVGTDVWGPLLHSAHLAMFQSTLTTIATTFGFRRLTVVEVEPPTLSLEPGEEQVGHMQVWSVENDVEGPEGHMLVLGTHALPLIPAEDPLFEYERLYLGRLTPPPDEEPKEPTLPLLMAYDLETYQIEDPVVREREDAAVAAYADMGLTIEPEPMQGLSGRTVVYSAQLAWGPTAEESLVLFGDEPVAGILYKAAELLYANTEGATSATMYAHNGARFDAIFIFNEVMAHWPKWARRRARDPTSEFIIRPDIGSSIIKENGRILRLVLSLVDPHDNFHELGLVLNLVDSLQFAIGTLRSLAKGFGVATQKGEIPYEDIDGPASVLLYRREIEEYGRDDVLALWQIMDQVIKGGLELDPYEPISLSPTAAGHARRLLFGQFLEVPFWNPPLALEQELRKWYKGGLSEAWAMGNVVPGPGESIEQQDVTSLYPFVMSEMWVPIGEASLVHDLPEFLPEVLSDIHPGSDTAAAAEDWSIATPHFLYVLYRHREPVTHPPFFAMSGGGRGLVRVYCRQWTPMFVTPTEFRYLIKNDWLGMEVRFARRAYAFASSERAFRPYVEHYFRVKAEEKRLEKEEPEAAAMHRSKSVAAKNHLNLSYGGLVMRLITNSVETMSLSGMTETLYNLKTDELPEMLDGLTKVEELGVRQGDTALVTMKQLMRNRLTNVFWGAEISAGARVVYYDMFYQAIRKGCRPLQGDTDSMMVLKPPGVDFQKDVVNQNPFWRKGPELGGLLSDYPEGIIETCHVAPKMYAVRYISGGKEATTIKFKGYRKSDCFLRKEELVIDGQRYLCLTGHRSREYLEAHGRKIHQLTFEDFKRFANGELDYILIARYQFTAGRLALATEKPGKTARRVLVVKRFRRQNNKGTLTDRRLNEFGEGVELDYLYADDDESRPTIKP